MPYQFNPDIQREIDEFANDDMTQCGQELAIAKMLLKRAVEDRNTGLANAILGTIAKLHATNLSAQIRTGSLIGINELSRLGQLLAASLTNRLSQAPGFEQLADVILSDWDAIFRGKAHLLTFDAESTEVPRGESMDHHPAQTLGRASG